MAKLTKFKIVSMIFMIIAAIFGFMGLSGGFGFSMNLYSQMAVDQKTLVTLNQANDFLAAIFFLLLSLYFKEHSNKKSE